MLNRRDLIKVTVSAIVAADVPQHASSQVMNLNPEGLSSGSKRLQIGLAGGYPFLNVLKTAGLWAEGALFIPPNRLDANGWITSAAGQFGTQFSCPSQTERPGQYVIKGEGSGEIAVSGGSFMTVMDRGLGWRKTISMLDQKYATFFIRKMGSQYIKNVRICHIDDEAALDAGQVFQTEYKNKIARFGVVRFMDAHNTNTSNVINWADRTPVSYFSYGVPTFPSQYYAGEIKQSLTNPLAYTASLSGFTLVDKARIIGIPSAATGFLNKLIVGITKGTNTVLDFGENHQFTDGMLVYVTVVGQSVFGTIAFDLSYTSSLVVSHTSTTITINLNTSASTGTYAAKSGYACAIPTLNVNGTGAIPIATNWGAPTSSPFAAKLVSTLHYDAGLNTWCCHTTPAGTNYFTGINGGWPPEICVQLCNEVSAHPWFNIPVHSLDAQGQVPMLPDYATQLAIYCKKNVAYGLKTIFEPSNEVWNNGFPQTQYAYIRQWRRNGRTELFGVHDWYGRATSQVGQLVSAVYENDRTKYSVICAFQTGAGIGGTVVNRLTCPIYVGDTSNAKAAHNWVTHVCVAGYWQPGFFNQPYEVTLANNYVAATGNPTLQAAIVDEYVESSLATGASWKGNVSGALFTIPKALAYIQQFKTFCTKYNLKFTQYEGGYSPDYIGGQTNQNILRGASRLSPLIVSYSQLNWNNFLRVGDFAEFPSEYMFAGGNYPDIAHDVVWPIWDPDPYATPTPPRWTAIITF